MQYILDKYNTKDLLENEIQVANNSLKAMKQYLAKLEADLESKMDEVVIHIWKSATGNDIINAAKLQIAYQEELLKALIKKKISIDK